MGQAIDKRETVDLNELLTSIIIQEEALVNLLDKKGVISKQELLKEIRKVQASLAKSQK